MEIRVGTRGSKLALAQTDWVIGRLKLFFPHIHFEKVIIKTTGDKIVDSPLSKIGGKGLFVKEIEEALLRKEIDLAVHSLKDVPSVLADGLEIGCIPERESPFDVWISDRDFLDLPSKSRVGTSSLRRMSQLKKIRKDLEILPLRGNVDTRLRKWKEGQFAGIVLAEAGLKRLNLCIEYKRFSIEEMVPAVGQGALAVEIRKDDLKIKNLLSCLHHEPTEICIRAERAFLRTLEGGCQVPLGAYAWLKGNEIFMVGFISDLEGERFYKQVEKGEVENPEILGERLAKRLLSLGGEKILSEIYQSS